MNMVTAAEAITAFSFCMCKPEFCFPVIQILGAPSFICHTLVKVLLVFKVHKNKHKHSPSSLLRVSAAASAPPTSLSPRKSLFHSLVEPHESPTPLLDISHTPTAEELLAHKVHQSLEEEKTESKRCDYSSVVIAS